jgi:uncharacterized membrane protein
MPALARHARWVAFACACALVILCFAWEAWLAPLRPGGSTLVLKALPMAVLLAGLWQGRRRAFQWATLVIWFYFTEGIVRAFSEKSLVAWLAGIELLLALLIVGAAVVHIRTQPAPTRQGTPEEA